MSLIETVGENHRVARRHRRLTQEAIADRIGQTPGYISAIERARRSVTLQTLELLGGALLLSPVTFFRSRTRTFL
jgi:transcriptional regulator with XRE-family HTH domain